MGKRFQHKHSGLAFENRHPGCMWGILQILDRHHWRQVKRMLPHKRPGSGRHAKGVGNQQSNISGTDAGKMQEHSNAEMDNSVIEGKMMGSGTTKISVKARIKALFAEETSRRKGRHHRNSTCPPQVQLMRTDSIHHLEPSDQDHLSEINIDVGSPRISHRKNKSYSATCSSDPFPLQDLEEPVTSKKKCELCGTMLSVNQLEHNQVDEEHGRHLIENHTLIEEKLDEAKLALLEQKLIYLKEHTRDVPLYQSKEFLDALDIVKLNKDLFLKILQDQGSNLAHPLHGQHEFSTKMGLTKSGSFPVASSYGRRASEPSKLKQKLKDTESYAKEEGKLQARDQAQESGEFKSGGDISEQSMPLIIEKKVDGNSEPNETRPETAVDVSSGSPLQLKNASDNQKAIKRLKDLKQRIKHAIKESRKERQRITMDAVLHRIPYGLKFSKDVEKEMADRWKDPVLGKDGKESPASSYESDQSGPGPNKGRLRSFRRTSSLNDSLDRYCHLFESSFNREAKYHISERLKLRTEGLPHESDSKSLGRILSLPDIVSYSYNQSEDSSDVFPSGTPIKTIVESPVIIGSGFDEQKSLDFPLGSENQKQPDTLVESGSKESSLEVSIIKPFFGDQATSTSVAAEKIAELGAIIDDSENLRMGDKASHDEQEVQSIGRLAPELAEPSPISVLNSSFQKHITSPTKFISEDLESKPRHLLLDDPDSLANQQYESGMNCPAVGESEADVQKIEIPSKTQESDFLHLQVDTKDEAEFNYVRDVLKLSGFSENEPLGTWHSEDQPLDPSVYEEVEECLLGPECSDSEDGYSNHLLLFDLINEMLMEIHERSFTYWPLPLSSLSHIRPMPMGYHVLEEVWASISWCLSSRPELDQSLDYLVSRDLGKDEGWMNLQFDSECVGLELEDLIFDDLLVEVICN